MELPGPFSHARQSCGCDPNARRVSVSAAMKERAKNTEKPANIATSDAICCAMNVARGSAVS